MLRNAQQIQNSPLFPYYKMHELMKKSQSNVTAPIKRCESICFIGPLASLCLQIHTISFYQSYSVHCKRLTSPKTCEHVGAYHSQVDGVFFLSP